MAKAKDPVCGMDVETSAARYATEHQGERYYFCGSGCRKVFESEPGKYLDPGYTPSMLGAFTDWMRAVLRIGRT